MAEPILSIRDLTVEFTTEDGLVKAVTGVSYDLAAGEVLGIVGESGSGKSVSMLSVLGLIPMPPGRIASGEALYKGRDLVTMPKKELRELRGGEMAMIFQDPMTSLNPVFTIGDQISEAVLTHNPDLKEEAARAKTIDGARSRNGEQPGGDGATACVVTRGVTKRLRKHVLQHVLRLGFVAEDTENERVEWPRVTVVQAGGRRLITEREASQARFVFGLRLGRRLQTRESRQKPHVPVEFYE